MIQLYPMELVYNDQFGRYPLSCYWTFGLSSLGYYEKHFFLWIFLYKTFFICIFTSHFYRDKSSLNVFNLHCSDNKFNILEQLKDVFSDA